MIGAAAAAVELLFTVLSGLAKLELTGSEGYSRRVLAVLRYLGT